MKKKWKKWKWCYKIKKIKKVEVEVEVVEVVFDVCSTLSLTPDGIWIWNTPGIFKSIFKLGVMPIFSHIF